MNRMRLLIALVGLWTGLAVAPLQAFAHVEPDTRTYAGVHEISHHHDPSGDHLLDACSIICSLACKFALTVSTSEQVDSAGGSVSARPADRLVVHERDVPIPPPKREAIPDHQG